MNITPTFNLKAVMRMTGLSADTLRAWERRYHLPMPERTPGGQRIYSQHDIDIIQWLIAKQSEGISISNSVGLWNELINNGTAPLEEDRSFASDHTVSFSPRERDTSLFHMCDQWQNACLDFNESLADQITNLAFALADPETVFKEIILKGMFGIGEGWNQGKVTVQQEHFASGVALRRLSSLISSTPPSNRKETILICCPPGEEHTLTGTYLTFLLRRQGYKVIDLGANVPITQLKETIQKIRPQLIVLSAQQLSSAAHLDQVTRTLGTKTPIGFGGRILKSSPSLKERIPAYYLGDTLEEAPAEIINIINNKSRPRMEEPKNPFQDLHELFEINIHSINNPIENKYSGGAFSGGTLTDTTQFINKSIAAALYLGDLDLLLPELGWMEGFLTARQVNRNQVSNTWRVYLKSVQKIIGQEATPLMNWFDSYLSKQETPDTYSKYIHHS